MDSPPRTPLSVGRPVLLTPQKYVDVNDEGNEENALNFANTPRSMKRDKGSAHDYCQSDIVLGSDPPGIKPTFSQDSDGASDFSVAHLKGWLDDFGKQSRAHYTKNNPKGENGVIQKAPSVDSDCESDLSVARLKGWLDDFGKQNRAHYSKVNHIGKAPSGVPLAKPAVRSKSATPAKPPEAPKPIRRHTDPATAAAESKKGPSKTPVRYKPRYQKDEVQATNDGYASVKKIAAWLADDPTADKKTKTVRRGMNIINKSRLFEKDLEDVIIEENRIIKGSVSRMSQQFQGAPYREEEDRYETASCVSVSDKKKWLQSAFGSQPVEEQEPDDDSIVSMSVLDKKKWLQNAFNGADAGRTKPGTTPSRYAKSKRAESAPGGPCMVPVRNEAAVNSVKQKFQERAASRRSLTETSDHSELKEPDKEEEAAVAKQKWQQHVARRTSLHEESKPAQKTEEKPVRAPEKSVALPAPQTSATANGESSVQDELLRGASESPERKGRLGATPSPSKETKKSAEEAEENHFGFMAARQKLLQRSAENGNPVTVFSKVQKRKQKFEKLQQEMRRASGPMGLLKPTWEQAKPSVGPRTAYTKSFVDNVAPKKSFNELP